MSRSKITKYEKLQIEEIFKWKKEEPSVVNKAFGVAVSPLAWLVKKIVPEATMKAAIQSSMKAGKKLADKKDILREANVDDINKLRNKFGIEISRRSISDYRRELKIPSSIEKRKRIA